MVAGPAEAVGRPAAEGCGTRKTGIIRPGPVILIRAMSTSIGALRWLWLPDIADANEAYVQTMGRAREELLGRTIPDAFPDDPSDPRASGVRNVSASVHHVLATGQPDAWSSRGTTSR